jgi:hypothetical protein
VPTSLSERLVNRLAFVGHGSRRPSRRTFLTTATLAGTALAVNPWDYLTKPQDAYGSVCGPGATCSAGWSAMCCSINNGRNTCPPNTYAGGWWKADRSSFCGGAARYYIDCNANPGKHFTCRCNKSNCDHRYVACNVFRYGQCNTQVKGTTAVVCRQISCTPPWKLYPGKCGKSSATDNNTKLHGAPCLTKSNTFPRTVTFAPSRHTLYYGDELRPGQRLTSPDRHTQLTMQTDGNLVLRNGRGVIWQTHTTGSARGGRMFIGKYGRLYVVGRGGKVKWQTKITRAPQRASVTITNDGRLVTRLGSRTTWQTNTHTP